VSRTINPEEQGAEFSRQAAGWHAQLEAMREQLAKRDIRIAELGAENARLREELSALRGEAQERENAAVQQGLAALADLRAEHARQDAAVEAELNTVLDTMAQAQQECGL
jgi:chromosome segregation ATPase